MGAVGSQHDWLRAPRCLKANVGGQDPSSRGLSLGAVLLVGGIGVQDVPGMKHAYWWVKPRPRVLRAFLSPWWWVQGPGPS